MWHLSHIWLHWKLNPLNLPTAVTSFMLPLDAVLIEVPLRIFHILALSYSVKLINLLPLVPELQNLLDIIDTGMPLTQDHLALLIDSLTGIIIPLVCIVLASG